MRSYPALKTIASLIKLVSILTAFVGVVVIVASMSSLSMPIVALELVVTAFIVLFSWAAAETILVSVNAGEDIANILHRVNQGGARLNEVVNAQPRSVALTGLPPAHGFASSSAESSARDPQQVAIERRERAWIAEHKCIRCGVQLNFARVSIEQKNQCPACEEYTAKAQR